MLITNFPYSYLGINSIQVNCQTYKRRAASKIYIFPKLFNLNLIQENMFFHDLDAFQLTPFFEKPNPNYDMEIGTVLQENKICAGILFFNKKAQDIIERIVFLLKKYKLCNEQTAIEKLFLLKDNEFFDKTMAKRIKKLGIEYNMSPRKLLKQFINAEKPLKIAHFHPFQKGASIFDKMCYKKGIKDEEYKKYKLKKEDVKIVPKELIKIIEKHCYKYLNKL